MAGKKQSSDTQVNGSPLPPLRRIAQATVGGVGAIVLVAAAVVVFGDIGRGGNGGSPAAQATIAASPAATAVVNAAVGNITIENAVVKTTGNDVAALYFTVKNAGPADKLTSETTNASRDTQLFNTVQNGPSTSMPLVESLDIPANGQVQVQAGGYHVMINDIKDPLSPGMKVHVTLTFATAGKVEFDAPVTGY